MSPIEENLPIETSYGGLVVREGQGKLELAIIRPAGRRTWALPKGGAEVGESGEDAAAREVREEAGIEGEVKELLGDVRYKYRRDGRLTAKVVYFYYCEYLSGSIADHDHEVDEVVWMPLKQAIIDLTYPGERRLAKKVLAKYPQSL